MKILPDNQISDIDTSTLSEERDFLELTTQDQLRYLCNYHPKIAEHIALMTHVISCIINSIPLSSPSLDNMFEFIWTKSKWLQISRATYLNFIMNELTQENGEVED